MYKFSHDRISHNFRVLINFRVFPCGIGGRGQSEFSIILPVVATSTSPAGGALPIIRTPATCFCEGALVPVWALVLINGLLPYREGLSYPEGMAGAYQE